MAGGWPLYLFYKGDNIIEESIIFIVSFTIITLIILKPYDLKWSCVFGRHTFQRHGVKHGMYHDKITGGLCGTTRQIYQCSCGKFKKAEDKDWIGGIK